MAALAEGMCREMAKSKNPQLHLLISNIPSYKSFNIPNSLLEFTKFINVMPPTKYNNSFFGYYKIINTSVVE